MHIGLRRGQAAGDPVVNGYTRLARGFVGALRQIPSINSGPGPNDLHTMLVSNPAGVLQARCARASDPSDDVRHTLCGIELGNARLYIGERGANGGPELWTSAYVADRQEIGPPNVEEFKLAIELGGRVRAWCTHAAVYDGTPGDALRGNGWIWQSSDANPVNNAGHGGYSQIVACEDNALHFANCPPLGTVTLLIGAEAPIVVNLDAAGAGSFDVDARRWPLLVGLTIKDAAQVVQAQLILTAAYGGDVIGHR